MKWDVKKNNQLNIDRIAFIGRTYAEYLKIFDLDEETLGQGPVLDCPAGAASFSAEAHKLGFNITACDILYSSDIDSLIRKGKKDIGHIYEKVSDASHLFTWEHYKNIESLIALREAALDTFASDFMDGYNERRYRHAILPHLPFPDNHFSLVFSSHFLFIYSDWLGYDFHIECLKEFVRVCSEEIRIYPLTGLNAKPYPHLDDILTFLKSNQINADIVKIPFEFQKGSNRIMRIRCK